MKISVLLSAVAVTFAFVAHVQAELIPESNQDVKGCYTWAEQHRNTEKYELAQAKCDAITKCFADRSDNRQDLRECMFEAESYFLRLTDGKPDAHASTSGVTTPAVTEVADSDYEMQGPEHKGWKNSDQGE